MAAEQFSLCWNNFHSNLSNGFHSLYQQEDFVDVTLAAEGRYLKAHKMVLSVCSQYFKELFQVNPCKHPIVILKDVSYNALRDLLQFMYLGEVSVSQEELSNLMKVAELLQIKGLTDGNMDPMNQNGVRNMNVTDVKSLSIDTRTFLKRSKSKKAKLEKCETPAKISKSNVSPECHEGDVQSTSSRLEAEADEDEETGSQSPPPPSLLVEPELLLEPIITPKTEPVEEPSDACDYSEHSIPEMDMATMLDTNLGETSSQTAWKIESQKIYQPSDANTQDAEFNIKTNRHWLTKRKARRCCVCNYQGKRKETQYTCMECNVTLCPIPCFQEYHLKYMQDTTGLWYEAYAKDKK